MEDEKNKKIAAENNNKTNKGINNGINKNDIEIHTPKLGISAIQASEIISNQLKDLNSDLLARVSFSSPHPSFGVGLSSVVNYKQEQEIANLKEKIFSLQADKNADSETINELKKSLNDLKIKQDKLFLLNRVHPNAQKLILEDYEAFKPFLNKGSYLTTVVSIDIRHSTQLMLQAQNNIGFANFLTELSQNLCNLVIENFGVFDKFTGDGILAFFPEFYTGSDGLVWGLKFSKCAHNIFNSIYHKHRKSFEVVSNDTGLGIGIDFGNTSIISVNNDLTVVGSPVVYACRLSSAPIGKTLVNQRAFNLLSDSKINFTSSEYTINFKNQGEILAYEVFLDYDRLELTKPKWMIDDLEKTTDNMV